MLNNTTTNWLNTTPSSNTWSNPFSSLVNWNNNPFTTTPFTTGVTTLVNNTPTTPLVNAYETSDSYVLELSAPGYSKDSFEVSYTNNNLTVKATLERTEKNEKNNYSYREFNYSSFTREFTLPNNVDTEVSRAKYDNGILTVLLPKTTNSSNHRTVKVS